MNSIHEDASNMKSIKDKIILGILLIIILLLLGFCYLLSFLITYIGSIISFILLLYLLSKLLANLLIFPGSYRFWLRMIESSFSKELSTQANTKFFNLLTYLNSLKVPSEDPAFSTSTIKLFPKLINTLSNNFSQMEAETTITPSQLHLNRLLSDLRFHLQESKIQAPELLSLWDLLQNPEIEKYTASEVDIAKCTDKLKEIIAFINQIAQRSIFRGGYLLGTESYMRIDLMRRFNCEQFWLTGAEGAKIDCLWISGAHFQEQAPVVVFCNPNAAYYEFSYFQTDWIELYVSSGVSLVMWNYRGYARSTGKPDLKLMKSDGEALIAHIRLHKNPRIIGVHGESLGGTIATHLALTSHVDFLFADRTFASLSEAAKFNYGKLAEILFKVVGPKDSNSVNDFIKVECPKLVSCDSNDIMIKNLGSLKAGVAFKYFSQNEAYRYPFEESALRDICRAMREIQAVGQFLKTESKEKKKRKKGHLRKGDLAVTLAEMFEEIIEDIDAGGEKMLDLFVDLSEFHVKMWVSVLGIWGSTPTLYSSDQFNNFQAARDKLEMVDRQLRIVIAEFELSENDRVKDLVKNIWLIVGFLEKLKEWIDYMNPNEGVTGKLLPLTCGHSGSFNSLERYLYEQHLQSAGFW